jgi:hypothetical protein
MGDLWKEKDGIFDVLPGSSISYTVTEAIELSSLENRTISFNFNNTTISVNHDSNSDLICRDFFRAISGYIDGKIGPYPATVLSEIEKEEDAHIEAENERKWQESQAIYDAKMDARSKTVESKLVNAPSIELLNDLDWQKSRDANPSGYGGAILSYAECWARLMQVEMANGKELKDIADSTSHEADTDGITGFMYGSVVSILAQCWKHGEQLRRWHNKECQFGNEGDRANEEGGVLNPALLNIG